MNRPGYVDPTLDPPVGLKERQLFAAVRAKGLTLHRLHARGTAVRQRVRADHQRHRTEERSMTELSQAHALGVELRSVLPPEQAAFLAAGLLWPDAGWTDGQNGRARVLRMLPDDCELIPRVHAVRSRSQWRAMLVGLAGLPLLSENQG